MTRPRITVYTRAGCHLCERAESEVRRLAQGRADVELVDVDADPALTQRYTVRVPVVEVDGREVAEFEVDPAVLRAVLGLPAEPVEPVERVGRAQRSAMNRLWRP